MSEIDNKLIEKFIEIGKNVHRDYLNGNELREKYVKLCWEIVKIDREKYFQTNERIPKREAMECPNCHKKYDDETNFCSNCGLNLNDYYNYMRVCPICNSLVPKDDRYCAVCGGKNPRTTKGENDDR